MDYYDYWSTCGADKWYTKEDTAKRMRDMGSLLEEINFVRREFEKRVYCGRHAEMQSQEDKKQKQS